MTKEELLAIKNPHEAAIAISTEESLSLKEKMELLSRYETLHNITVDEMMYYPNGERVLKPEMFLGEEQ